MKHLNYLFSLALIVLGFSWASADVVAPYSVDFNTTISTSAKDFKVAPGWKHIASTSYWGMTYSYESNTGVDESGTLWCSSQSSSSLDYLVTPALTGNMSLAVKLTRSSSYIKFFAVSEDLTVGETALFERTYSSDADGDWVTVSLSGLENQRIAILTNSVYIDNFAADQADIVLQPALKVTFSTGGWMYPDCDTNNDFSFTYNNVTVENTGERTLLVNEDGYSISIAPRDNPTEAIDTYPIPVDLAVGETYTFETVVVTDNYSNGWTGINGKRMDIYENIGLTSTAGNWIKPNPYLPGMTVKNGTDDLSESAKAAAFGKFGNINTTTTKTVTVNSTGAAPLVGTVTLTADGCFSISSTEINLAGGESATFTITADASTPGVFTGSLVFAGEGVESVTIPLSALVLDSSKFYEPFTDNASSKDAPQGWYAPTGNWEKTNKTNGDNNYMKATLGAYHKLVTPLLRVAEGETFSFEAARLTNSYLDEYGVKVYYSADRENWTLVKELLASELPEKPTGTYSWSETEPAFQTIIVEGVPAGDYYIAFESGYCALDNVYGFERVAVTHDVVVENVEIAPKVQVNNDLTATVTLRNLNDTEETEYTAVLNFNGVEVASAQPVAIPASGTAQVAFTFVPNTVGTFPAQAQFVFGDDYTVTTAAVNVQVTEESLEEMVQVGTVGGTSSGVPIYVLYNNSETETLYTAAQLSDITAGTAITSLNYKGYYTGSKDLKPQVTVWLANDETGSMVNTGATALFNTEGMTQVFDGEVTLTAAGSSDYHDILLSLPLDEAFVYTGGNLRVIIRSLYTDWTSGFNIEVVSTSNSDNCLRRYNDTRSTFESGATTSKAPVAVLYLGTEKEPVVYTGIVTDTNGDPIEGVTVTLASLVPNAGEGAPHRAATAGPAVYSAVTDADGAFTVPVVQADKIYNATFSKDGYKPVTVDGIDFSNGDVELSDPVVMERDTETGVANISGKSIESVKYYNVAGQAADKAFNGINIVVTTYTDGTTSTVKMVK